MRVMDSIGKMEDRKKVATYKFVHYMLPTDWQENVGFTNAKKKGPYGFYSPVKERGTYMSFRIAAR